MRSAYLIVPEGAAFSLQVVGEELTVYGAGTLAGHPALQIAPQLVQPLTDPTTNGV